jgi:membrane fusion protein (multidrug efflux system)
MFTQRQPAALPCEASFLLAKSAIASVFLILLVAGALALAGCQPQGGDERALEPPRVGVIAVREQKVNPFFEFVAKTGAAETVALRARVTGFLEERPFEEGGEVEAGQVLFRIEPEQYQATLSQAEAALGAAEASLNRAQVDLKRYQELLASNNVSRQEVDKTQAEVLVQEAKVETAKADIEKARLNVDYTEVVAPITGRIDLAAYDVGNLIGPDSGVLATINRMDPIKVNFSIAETWYLDLARQGTARPDSSGDADEAVFQPRLRLPDGSLYEHTGAFDFIDNKVDEKTGTVTVRAEFPNPEQLLLPGQFVTVVIERRDAVDRVLIPQAAVLTDQGGAYVLLVNDEDVVEARRIETGQRFGPNLVVEEGLEPGERIVLYGIQKVRPGLAVNPEPAEAPVDPMRQGDETATGTTAASAGSAGSATGENAGAETDSGGEGAEAAE